MAVEGAHWVIFDKADNDLRHHFLSIRGDSTVNGTIYKKLYRRAIDSEATLIQDFLPPYKYVGDEQLVGLIRDDIAQESVYGIYFPSQISDCDIGDEFLLDDFSLVQGEYLPGCLHQYQGTPLGIVDSVKVEFIWNNQRRVQYVSAIHRFVEGVGGSKGPFSSSLFPVPTYLSRIIDYCVGTDFECGLMPVPVTENIEEGFNIYPNPVVNGYFSFKLKITNGEPLTINLFDITGRLVWSNTMVYSLGSEIKIGTIGLNMGLYILNVKSNNLHVFGKLLIY